jgi:putative DNA methylase
MTYKKKLIEVAIPLEAINAASAREKSIRHGHPSTLHLWWARRPLAACRAVLFAQLVDDPSSHPDQFPTHEDQERERQRLFAIIEDLVKWENSTNEEVLERARAEIRRSCGGVLPPVYDPFSGGGSIPLEAQRLGLPAYGSDLNPVAVMIGKAMIEIPPKFKDMPPIHPGIKERSFYRNAEGLAEDVKYYGEWMREKAWERIGHLYPQVDLPKEYGGGKATVVAWIWARTVPSPDPAFANVQVPLVRSFELSSKKGQTAWVEPVVANGNYEFVVKSQALGHKGEPRDGTVNRQGAVCIVSSAAIPFKYIRQMAKDGRMGQRLMAVVAEGPKGKIFLSPDQISSEAAISAKPDEKPSLTISHWPGRTNVVEYGMENFEDLFTDRQTVALNTFATLVHDARAAIEQDALAAGLPPDKVPLRDGGLGAKGYAEAVSVYLAFIADKCSDYNSSICSWIPQLGAVRNTFARQAIPMVWDFVEVNIFSGKVGSFGSMSVWVEKALLGFVPAAPGQVKQMDAQSLSMLPNSVVSTDPPYYDNISYADLSDFFYCWLRPALRDVYPDLFGVLATPKADELVATPYRDNRGKQAAEEFFLRGMKSAIERMAFETSNEFPAAIYYAFKQSEIEQEGISSTGWATFLQAVVEAGFAVVGTWPVRTEFSNRPVASGSNALANSVVLVCRKKEASAEVITRAEFIRALKRELPPAIAELQAANIAPADMPQSAIGPGMGVFSRYKAVLESDDSPMTVKAALQLINRELDEYLGGIQGEFDADTRFAITWFEQNGLKAGDYGTANNIATARGISVESVKHAGIVESAAGKVRILKRDEMDAEWEPDADGHLTVWECCQHLVRLHEKYGIGYEAAVMLKKFGPKADDVRDLAYVLYNICEKRGDAKEATAYNALIADWTDLTREAATAPLTNRSGQMRFEV